MRRAMLGLLGATVLAGCGGGGDAALDNAWVRLPAVSGRPGAAYFHLRTGKTPRTLIGVATPIAARGELHESMASGGMMTMAPLKQVAVPAGGAVTFAPGARHAMLFDITPAATPGSATTLTLRFADGSTMAAPARVLAAGDPAPQ